MLDHVRGDGRVPTDEWDDERGPEQRFLYDAPAENFSEPLLQTKKSHRDEPTLLADRGVVC
jgi:hypothetical protein